MLRQAIYKLQGQLTSLLGSSRNGTSTCTITPPTDCNGHGTLLSGGCMCNCTEGYKNDLTNLVSPKWCSAVPGNTSVPDGRPGVSPTPVSNTNNRDTGSGPAGFLSARLAIIAFVLVILLAVACGAWCYLRIRHRRAKQRRKQRKREAKKQRKQQHRRRTSCASPSLSESDINSGSHSDDSISSSDGKPSMRGRKTDYKSSRRSKVKSADEPSTRYSRQSEISSSKPHKPKQPKQQAELESRCGCSIEGDSVGSGSRVGITAGQSATEGWRSRPGVELQQQAHHDRKRLRLSQAAAAGWDRRDMFVSAPGTRYTPQRHDSNDDDASEVEVVVVPRPGSSRRPSALLTKQWQQQPQQELMAQNVLERQQRIRHQQQRESLYESQQQSARSAAQRDMLARSAPGGRSPMQEQRQQQQRTRPQSSGGGCMRPEQQQRYQQQRSSLQHWRDHDGISLELKD